jgi:lambda repressor-like predicted transcriptional regulator
MRVLAYVRASTEEQAESGAGLAAQRETILAECRRRGWELVEVIEDAGYSAKDLKRPGIQAALRALRAKEAEALVVAKLDRLSRSMLDFPPLMARAQKEGWALVALDVGMDTTTPAGEMTANVTATFALSQAGFDGDLDPRFRPGERRPSPDVYAEEVPGGVARASRQARVGERPTDRGGREGSRCRPGVPAHVGAPGAG